MKLLLATGTVILYCIAQYGYVAEEINVQQLASKLKIKEKLQHLKDKQPEAGALIEEVIQTFVDLLDGLNYCEEILSDPPTESELARHFICTVSYTSRAWVAALQLQRLSEAEIENIESIRDGISYALSVCV